MSKPGGRVRLAVQVTPNARRSEVVERVEGVLRVRLHAPPVDGKANEALVRLIATLLHVPKGTVSIASGHTGRRKVVEIVGSDLDLEQIIAALLPTLPPGREMPQKR